MSDNNYYSVYLALSLAETPWNTGMASTLDRDELHLLSAAAVAATLMTKKKKEREMSMN